MIGSVTLFICDVFLLSSSALPKFSSVDEFSFPKRKTEAAVFVLLSLLRKKMSLCLFCSRDSVYFFEKNVFILGIFYYSLSSATKSNKYLICSGRCAFINIIHKLSDRLSIVLFGSNSSLCNISVSISSLRASLGDKWPFLFLTEDASIQSNRVAISGESRRWHK